jgi:dienelactone hydrolase
MKASTLLHFLRCISLALTISSAFVGGAAHAESLDPTVNEQIIMLAVISNGSKLQFETTIFRPPGEGPFPLLLMNHGKERGSPSAQRRDRFLAMSREFVKRGYAVVVPMRKGFAGSGGHYSDFGCNMTDNGLLQADDIESALNALVQQPWVDKKRIIVAGQSYGGLATMAFGTRQFPGVRGLLNFAGGLRIDGSSCDWKSSMVSAFANYGARTLLPSLWFYGENDSYFDHSLAERLQQAYQSAGGPSQLIAYGHFKNDAHGMIGSRDGVATWLPETERFLKSLGMPTDPIIKIAETPRPSATDFASVDNIAAVPFLTDKGRTGYRDYLSKSAPRAFALSPTGAWSWAEEGDDPSDRALASCQKNSSTACKLYAIDNDVVWSTSAASLVPPVSIN